MKKMRITLHKDGTQTIEVFGAKGSDCIEFSKHLEERLGTPARERVLKAEFYESETVSQEREFEKNKE